jgi:hypothetical protein
MDPGSMQGGLSLSVISQIQNLLRFRTMLTPDSSESKAVIRSIRGIAYRMWVKS